MSRRKRLIPVNGRLELPRGDRIAALEGQVAALARGLEVQNAKQAALITACLEHGLPFELFRAKLKDHGITLVQNDQPTPETDKPAELEPRSQIGQ